MAKNIWKYVGRKYKLCPTVLQQNTSLGTDNVSHVHTLRNECCYKNNQDENLPSKIKHSGLMDMLTKSCKHVFNTNCPSKEHMDEREEIRSSVENYLKCRHGEGIQLKLFGSSQNGFTFHSSDLDFCLPLKTNKSEQDKIILQFFSNSLKKCNTLSNVIFLHQPAVPIIKFCVPAVKLVGDISLNNTLGIYNTKLLYTYVKIDHRCQELGYMFKHFLRNHCHGTSYSYIMLVIYFLQQCETPVLPVLQELFEENKKPDEVLVDGWNVWFYEDIENIPKVWKNYGKNTASVGELWCEFLQFYKTFDWESKVICIRRKQTLTINEKMHEIKNKKRPRSRRKTFNKKVGMYIEDPFELTHNLFRSNTNGGCIKYYLSKAYHHLESISCQNGKPRISHLKYLDELVRLKI